ncbi:MAG: hypothetical protein MJZ69_04715 [Bacteroidaceae bacterium]|nr:hypothetical protein [Bacteroidaceae bacterium]
MDLIELKKDCSVKQKKGIHFIMASVVIWGMIAVVHSLSVPIETKNLLTFCCSTPLMPLAYAFSRLLKIDFQQKDNPLTKLGLLFSINQIVYLLIVMWVFAAVPEKMLMVYAMVFGAHLMPYSWLYDSKSYLVLSILIPIVALVMGLTLSAWTLAVCMLVIEVIFCMLLMKEVKGLIKV